MSRGIKVGRLFGVDVLVKPSLLLLVALITWNWGSQIHPEGSVLDSTTGWYAGVAVAVLIILSILVHELAHTLVAKSQGIPVSSIVIHLFGGAAHIDRAATSPLREAFIAGSGPLSNVALGLILQETALLGFKQGATGLVLYTVGYINLMLAIMNLIPGLPLDGGRILHAVFWAAGGDTDKAMRRTATASSVVGGIAIAAGLWLRSIGASTDLRYIGSISLGYIDWFWLCFLGFLMLSAGAATKAQERARKHQASLHEPAPPSASSWPADASVADVMTAIGDWIPPNITLSAARERYFDGRSLDVLPVEGAPGEFDGILSLTVIQRTPQSMWSTVRVKDVMTASDRVVSVGPDEPAHEAYASLLRLQLDYLAVIENGRLLGFVRRDPTPS